MILGRGGKNDNASIGLATKTGKRIPNEIPLSRPRESYLAAHEIQRRTFFQIKLNSLGGLYNCVGLVFASRRTWIETDYVSMILQEDGYTEILEQNVLTGDVIIYKDSNGEVNHIGLIHSWENFGTPNSRLWILSKWGHDNEYVHLVQDLPESISGTLQYWTHRKT